jgi:hypothetical protein
MALANDDSFSNSGVFEDNGSDEDEENHQSAIIKQRLATRKQNQDQAKDDDSSEEDDDEEEEEEEELLKDDDDDDDDEFEEEEVDEDDDEEEDEEEEDEDDVPSRSHVNDASPIDRPIIVQDADDDDDDDDDDEDDVQDTLGKKPKKSKQPLKLAPITAITAEDTDEDIAMKELLGEWGVGNDEAQPNDDEGDDDEDSSEASERIVQLEDGLIDHIVLAAPDLEEAMEQFEQMTGIGAKIFGAINGIGIRCARISFNDSSYLEIIAPDSKQPGPIGQLIKSKGIKDMTPFAFAIRSSRAEQLKDEVRQFKYVPDHITMFGGKKDGTQRKWEMLHLYGHSIGGICPYFVHWDNTDHPCATLPVVGKLKKITIRAPSDDPIHQLLAHVGVRDIHLEVGTPKMSFQFSSPEGTIKFATSKAVGYKFPGFDDEEEGLDNVTGAGANDDDEVFESPESPELLEIENGEYETLPAPAY